MALCSLVSGLPIQQGQRFEHFFSNVIHEGIIRALLKIRREDVADEFLCSVAGRHAVISHSALHGVRPTSDL